MSRIVFALTLVGALFGGVMGWALNLNYEGQVNNMILYEQPVFYASSLLGLDYRVRNNSENYIWGFIVGLEEKYFISCPNSPEYLSAYGVNGDNQDNNSWWGWEYWGSVVLSPEELSSELLGLYEDAFDLSEGDIGNILNFVKNNILPIFEDYENLYFAYQVPLDTVDGIEIESHPISPGSTASGFGVLRDDNLILGSPVVFIGTSDEDPNENSSWKFGKTDSVLVPEPMSGCLFLLGLMGSGLVRRRR